ATPNVVIMEHCHGHNPLLHELVPERFELVNGCLAIPDRPGLGVTPDPAFVAEFTRRG
ncbi:MAG: mandelate racemase/muconate lactonizing enzyme family protein, partial [Armatimonadetes bacterium]|nr:mandelate racemase/muconate lactonizing enzyme family protein [Armatimonadota bacterium]